MQKVRVLKLGTECVDRATELKGTLTHWLMNMSGRVEYLFQPHGLNDEGQPVKKLYLSAERLMVDEGDFEIVLVPFEILGTEVTDKASGFTGMAVEFVRHLNGCFHVDIQPKGMSKKGTPINNNNFDLRQCFGEMIVPETEEERKVSTTEKPSPEGLEQFVFEDVSDIPVRTQY